MKHSSGILVLAAVLSVFLLFVQGCATAPEMRPDTLTLTIVHVNDTHSHLDPVEATLTVNSSPTKVQLGGVARLKTALDELRGREQHVLFLHGGDMVQGTLYFTKYAGRADAEFMNLIGIDVMCIGNHEFDRGPELLAELVERVNFPFVSANTDVSREPTLAGKVAPFIVKKIGGQEIGIIGLTTMEAPAISNPGPNIVFADPVISIGKAVEALHARGVTKIILLSHSGYQEDIALGEKISGLSLIVGGHTHSLLGDKAAFASLGLTVEGPYPTVVKNPIGKNVLIVQAWEWGKMLGVITATLDADGEAVTWSGRPKLLAETSFRQNSAPVDPASAAHDGIIRSLKATNVVEFHDENPEAKKMLEDYASPLQEMLRTTVAVAAHDLKRGDNAGPGPLVADAMLWKTRAAGTRIAIQNTGGIRRDIAAGPISVATVYELLPFGNTLVIIDLKGSELKAALEEAVDFQLAAANKSPYVYIAGAAFRLDASAPKGFRIQELRVHETDGGTAELDYLKTYRIVTNNYLARGGGGIPTLGSATGYRTDTGFTDAEVFLEYLKSLETIHAPAERRISSALPETLRCIIFRLPPAEIRKAA